MQGLIHLYCGDGKGKTTAAFGLVARHASYGKKVLVTQFLKDFTSGEIGYFEKDPLVTIIKTQRVVGFFPFMTTEKQQETIVKEQALFEEITHKASDYSLLVMDEIIDACNLGILEYTKVADFLKNKPAHLEVVCTGRNPDASIIALAHYYTEFKAIKHPFQNGIAARASIEY
ncbi:MAG: cob(I)yrinic acid a,c-diamide adenosyltransferase [Erysipelotrichaceae bacterium]